MTEVPEQRRDMLAERLRGLRGDSSGATRAAVAQDVAKAYAAGHFSNAERALACEIFEALARDVDSKVRQALSQQLCNSPMLPPKLARQLAADVEAVACPVLRYSLVLEDDDLLAILRPAGQAKLHAVAARERVSARVSQVLVERGDENVVAGVLSNPGAQVAEASLERALERYPESPRVHAGLVDRPRLPLPLAVRLVDRISDELIDRLVTRHHLPAGWAQQLGGLSADAAYIDMVDEADHAGSVAALVDGLHARGRLTPLLLLRALMTRHPGFFFHAMARLTSCSPKELARRLPEQGPGERRLFYAAAGVAEALFPAFNAALGVLAETRRAHGYHDQESFERAAVEQLVRIYPGLAPGDVDSVLARLQQLFYTGRVEQPDQNAASRLQSTIGSG